MGAYSDDLLFIHIPKCAGTAVREWLKQYVPGTTDFRDEGCGLPIGHVPLRDIERFTGRSPASFRKIIAIVRNPYTHQLSQWLFWRNRRAQGGVHLHDRVASAHPTLTDWLHDARCDFHVWYESMHGLSDPSARLVRTAALVNRYPNHGGYYRYWLEVDGAIPDNVTVMRMEELGDVWHQELADFVPDGTPDLPIVNAGPRSILTFEDAISYYTPVGIEIVNDKFDWVFAHGLYPQAHPNDPLMWQGFAE